MKLAVLGCGAATERLHLPAARRVAGLEVTTLVDRDLDRARACARRFGVKRVVADYATVEADAVLVALPNRLHATVAVDFLSRGIAVLVEKPMALSGAEARTMIAAANRTDAVLQIGMSKRFAHGARAVREVLDSGLLGPIESFSIDWGVKFDWPLASAAGMAPDEAGGGVLMDFGSHFLDLMCGWLGAPELVSYADDANGGLEADCVVNVSMRGAAQTIPVTARFSRLRAMRNVVRASGRSLALEWAHETPDAVAVVPLDWSAPVPHFVWQVPPPQSGIDVYADQLRAFMNAVTGRTASPVPGESVLPSLELIERCYATREAISPPWDYPVHLPAPAR